MTDKPISKSQMRWLEIQQPLPVSLRSIADELHLMVSSQYFPYIREKLRLAADRIEELERQVKTMELRRASDAWD